MAGKVHRNGFVGLLESFQSVSLLFFCSLSIGVSQSCFALNRNMRASSALQSRAHLAPHGARWAARCDGYLRPPRRFSSGLWIVEGICRISSSMNAQGISTSHCCCSCLVGTTRSKHWYSRLVNWGGQQADQESTVS